MVVPGSGLVKAQAEEEGVPLEDISETEVAKAEEEVVPQEEPTETEVAQAEEVD